jgi:diguanylate cyclase (GGDEF)-like protein
VVLPVVALSSLLLVQVRHLGSTAVAAREFQRDVENGAAWVELRIAVQDERLFVEALAVTREFGVPVSLVAALTGVDFEEEALHAGRRTDDALARVDTSHLARDVAALHRARAAGADRDVVRTAFDALERAGSVHVTAGDAAVEAASAGLPLSNGVHSDLDALWSLEAYSSAVRRQLNALFAYLSATSPEVRREAHDKLVIAQAAAQDITARLAITAPTWARRLGEAEDRPEVLLIEKQIATIVSRESADEIAFDDFQELGQLFIAFEARHDAIAELFTGAATVVRGEAARIEADAAQSRRRWAATGAALLVASVALAAGAAALIRSPLRRLEQVAADLSHGRLDTSVELRSGPREVAVVGAALNQAITGLRAVAERAEHLIEGRATVATAHYRGPVRGPLNEAIDTTLATLERSWQEQAELRAQLVHSATHDPLTGLTNRTALNEHLAALRPADVPADRALGILFIDLDGFKQVNDRWGHAAGDAVLVEAANRLQQVCRGSDLVARIGGDEFVVVLSEPTRLDDVGGVAQRILASLSRPYAVADTTAHVGASIGVAISDRTDNPGDLLGSADEALYRAKKSGRGRIHFHATAPQYITPAR